MTDTTKTVYRPRKDSAFNDDVVEQVNRFIATLNLLHRAELRPDGCIVVTPSLNSGTHRYCIEELDKMLAQK